MLQLRFGTISGTNAIQQKKVGCLRRLADNFLSDQLAGKEARWASGYRSGPMSFFDLRRPVDEALDWLTCEAPDYLMVYPTYLRSMIQRGNERGFKPARLQEVATVSEVVDSDLRNMCRESWNAKLVDMYSAQEVGFIALECPYAEHYHVQSECNLVEILDNRGRPCRAGETGRVVVTPLHNFAFPIIRYDLGDYAEVGALCPGMSRSMLKS